MNLYSGKNLEEALDRAADGENVDVEYLQYRIITNEEGQWEIEAYFVADVIDLQAMIVAVKDYDNYNLGEFNADYFEGKTIDVKGFVDYFDGDYQIEIYSVNDVTIHH